MKKSIIKVITLILFISLILSFIGYRSGFFAKKNNSNNDTTSDSIKKIEVLSSSKSLILIDHTKTEDSLASSNSKNIESRTNSKDILHSSKLGIILNPNDIKEIKRDSIQSDSIERK